MQKHSRLLYSILCPLFALVYHSMAKDDGNDSSDDEPAKGSKTEDSDVSGNSDADNDAETKPSEGDDKSDDGSDSADGDKKPTTAGKPGPVQEQLTGSPKKVKDKKKKSGDAPNPPVKIRPKDSGARMAKLALGEFIVERRVNQPSASVQIDRTCTMGQTRHIDPERVKEVKTDLLAAPPKERLVLLCWDDQGV